MEERDIIIREILEKLYLEFSPENLSRLTIDQYRDFFFSIFEYINLYKNKYHLTEEDFVDFSKSIHHRYNYDDYADNCWERVGFLWMN